MLALHVILKPIVTEKAIKQAENNQYSFLVHPKATKIDVKMATRELYGAEVAKVSFLKVPAKTRAIGKRVIQKRQARKKAIITLKGKKKIDVTKITKEPPAKK